MDWLDDDLASRTVADRVAMYRKHLSPRSSPAYGVEHDRVRLLEDRDGDGKADRSTVFADGFHDVADGIGAGLRLRRGDVYFTCIPSLWLLRDTDGDGKADVRKVLCTGYGVHVAFLGHDLHGLRFGPDGKLYFSIGDRGLNVERPTTAGTSTNPDSGAVLRCDPDGTDLEIFATGLRNPQELAFDEYGNLFTGDNNSDSGDPARWVYVVEGGDSGWRDRLPVRTSTRSAAGPGIAEKLWHPDGTANAAYIVPPRRQHRRTAPRGWPTTPAPACPNATTTTSSSATSAAAPAAAASTPSRSSRRAQRSSWRPRAVRLGHPAPPTSTSAPTAALYVTDWVDGWDKTGQGPHLHGLRPAKAARTRSCGDVKQAARRGDGERDRRRAGEAAGPPRHARPPGGAVRPGRQGRGVDRAAAGVAPKTGPKLLPRLHAIWGLGQIGRKRRRRMSDLIPLLAADDDAEVRGPGGQGARRGEWPGAFDG